LETGNREQGTGNREQVKGVIIISLYQLPITKFY